MNMRYKPPRLTDKELLETFPEAREIVPLKIKEYNLAIREKEAEIQSQLKRIYALETDSFSEWFGEEMVNQLEMPGLVALEKNLFRLKRLEYLLNPKKESNNRFEFQEKIEIARRFPIEELARNSVELRQAGRNFISLCPFHNEKHASFYIYPETNTFHCFGCQKNGDVIKLTMPLCGIGFIDAVKMLQN
jgi:hypothetical protein